MDKGKMHNTPQGALLLNTEKLQDLDSVILIFVVVSIAGETMNYARFLTAVSAARKPSPIRILSE